MQIRRALERSRDHAATEENMTTLTLECRVCDRPVREERRTGSHNYFYTCPGCGTSIVSKHPATDMIDWPGAGALMRKRTKGQRIPGVDSQSHSETTTAPPQISDSDFPFRLSEER